MYLEKTNHATKQTSCICAEIPLGALSNRTSNVLLPNPNDVNTIRTETTIAATASAFGILKKYATVKPVKTMPEVNMSTLKCSASASKAWLPYFLADFVQYL